MERVCAARALKPSTIYTHLAKCVVLGQVTVSEVTGLGRSEIARIEGALTRIRGQGFGTLTAVSEALGGEYGYEILRCAQAGMNRE